MRPFKSIAASTCLSLIETLQAIGQHSALKVDILLLLAFISHHLQC